MKRIILFVLSILLLVANLAFTADTISPEEAINHIGQQATVCGNVTSTHFASRSKGQPTFIDLNSPYPNQIFTVFIWGSDRGKFSSAPETYYNSKNICVRGLIVRYRGTPEIIVRDPSQISVK